ncbi:MAG: hypothetical protein ACRCYQ_07085 [Nocardioides sp.]
MNLLLKLMLSVIAGGIVVFVLGGMGVPIGSVEVFLIVTLSVAVALYLNRRRAVSKV